MVYQNKVATALSSMAACVVLSSVFLLSKHLRGYLYYRDNTPDINAMTSFPKKSARNVRNASHFERCQ